MTVSMCSQEEQFADLMRELHQLSEAYNSGQNNTQHPEKPHINSSWTLMEKKQNV